MSLRYVPTSALSLNVRLYFIKLDMFGYTDISGSVDAPAIPATRLNQLKRHIDARNELDWMEFHIDVPPQYSGFGILCQGIFATFNLKSVCCIHLPHVMRGIQFRTWTLGDFSFPIHQIEIDPSNNLLVVASTQVLWLIGNHSAVKLALNL
jgi:hypothetical protein